MAERDPFVVNLQTMLHTLQAEQGKGELLKIDGIFGSKTEAAVREYQQLSGLPVTGKADAKTMEQLQKDYRIAKINHSQAQPLQIVLQPNQKIMPNDRNCHMYLIQAMLFVLSGFFDNMPVPPMNGKNDAATQASVRFLKNQACGKDDAVVDKEFYAALVNLYRCIVHDGTCMA